MSKPSNVKVINLVLNGPVNRRLQIEREIRLDKCEQQGLAINGRELCTGNNCMDVAVVEVNSVGVAFCRQIGSDPTTEEELLEAGWHPVTLTPAFTG